MRRSTAVLICSALMFACNFPTTLTKITPTAQHVPTPRPTSPAESAAQPTATELICDSKTVLNDVRNNFPYPSPSATAERVVLHFQIHNTHSLIVWFVDLDINPSSTPEEVPDLAALARKHASQVAYRIVDQNPCVTKTFTNMDLIVVDADQNGWFSGSISPLKIPAKEDQEAAGFESVYLRSAAPEPFSSAAACSWEEARLKARGHFAGNDDPSANLDFYSVVDGRGMIVYAQWIAFSDTFIPTAEMASVLNVAQEMNCLARPVDQLVVTVVDDQANVKMLGTLTGQAAVKNLDLNQFEFRVIPEGMP